MVQVSTPRSGDVGDPDFDFVIQDVCYWCGNHFQTSNINDIGCESCERKEESKKEAWAKDNAGDGTKYGRLGNNAAIPIKIGGTYYGKPVQRSGRLAVENFRASQQLEQTEAWWTSRDLAGKESAYEGSETQTVINETVDDLVAKGKVDRRVGARFHARKVA